MSAPDGLKFEHACGGLIVRIAGRHMIENKLDSFKKIRAAIEAHSAKAAVIDGRSLTGVVSFMDRYQIGELGALHLTQVPVAVLLREAQIDKQRISQLVAANRGTHFEVFTDESAALAWLKKMVAAAR